MNNSYELHDDRKSQSKQRNVNAVTVESMSSDDRSRQEKLWHSADVLKGRMDSLNDLVRRRGSLVQINAESESCPDAKFVDIRNIQRGKDHSKVNEERSDTLPNKLGSPHCLSKRSGSLAITDASRRLSFRLEADPDDLDEFHDSNFRIAHQSSSRNLLTGGKRSKRSIQNIVKQLQSNSTKYLSRAANSIRFRINDANGGMTNSSSLNIYNKSSFEDFPISLGGVEMHPDLLLKLGCARMKLDRGKGFLRTLCSDQISSELFVYMFWFIHCRFFQVSHKTALLQVRP